MAEKYLDIPKMLDAEGKYIPLVQSAPCFVGMTYGNFRKLAEPARMAEGIWVNWGQCVAMGARAGAINLCRPDTLEWSRVKSGGGGLEKGPLWGLPLGPEPRHPAEPCLTQSHPSLRGTKEVAKKG